VCGKLQRLVSGRAPALAAQQCRAIEQAGEAAVGLNGLKSTVKKQG
jgi:hypothetical protein